MKKVFIYCIIFTLSILSCGCYDSQEIDKSAYVIALGIDKSNDGYNYTFQISSPLAMGGGGEVGNMGDGEKNTRVENITIGSDSLSNARKSLNNFLSKKISLSHLKIIVFSEEVTKKGLYPHLPFLLREREIRPDTKLAVSTLSAEDFLKGINPALEANTAEYYDLVFENGMTLAPAKTLWEFANEQETFASAIPCGLVSNAKNSKTFSESDSPKRISTSKAEFSGLYLIKNYKLVDKLSPSQSQIYALLSGAINEIEFNIQDENINHSIKLRTTDNADYHITRNNVATSILCKIKFSAEVIGPDKNIDASTINDFLVTEACSLFNALSKNKCDILLIGNTQKKLCKTISQWESLKWNNNFNKYYFIPEISVTISKINSTTI